MRRRAGLLLLACGLFLGGGPTLQARGQGRAGATSPSVVAEVRTALGRGQLDRARRLVQATPSGEAGAELARALVEIFVGEYEAAQARLQPLAAAAPLGEAALELGLLDLRRGRREEGDSRLQRLAAQRRFAGPDDYLRVARAARAVGEVLLANDVFQEVAAVARADIQTEWGDLFLQRHRNGEAATSYNEALAGDRDWVRAWVGLARALEPSEPEAADAALAEAATRAPNHPDVLLFTAERRLAREDVAGAREALDRLGAVRARSVEEAALRVAIAYEERGLAGVEPVLGPVRAADPRSALGYRRAGQQAAQNYRFLDAVSLARQAVALDPDDAAAHLEFGLYLMRTGDERGARPVLERSWDLDWSAPVTKNLLDLLDRLDRFTVVESGPLTFKFSPEEAAVLRPYAIPLAEDAYRTFAKRYGFTPEGPILIEVFPIHDDFAVRTLGLPGLAGALGACFGRVVTMDSPKARPPGEFSWQATLWHEMAHVFSLQLSDYRVPRWLTEGISGFEEHRRVPAWGRELTLEFAAALSRDRTFGVKGLPDAFKRPESLALAYFEASLVVEHLVELRGDAGLQALLRAYADGASDAEAFARAFGQTVEAVDGSFRRFVETRYGALRDAMRESPGRVNPADLSALRQRATEQPGSFQVQLAYGQALFKAGDLRAARAPLERAAALAPQASGDGSPRALLAEIARDEGDLARARRELRALLAFDHANVGAARRLAAISADAPDDLEYAWRLIADLDPFDAETHGRLGQRLMADGDVGAALVEFEVALALGPPNVAEAHADIADALLKLGRRDEAKQAALRALQEAPTFARAQDLLLAAIGRQ